MIHNPLSIEPSLWAQFHAEAQNRGLHVSDLLAEAITSLLASHEDSNSPKHTSNLEDLAGTWSEKESNEFDCNTTVFGAIDHDMWK